MITTPRRDKEEEGNMDSINEMVVINGIRYRPDEVPAHLRNRPAPEPDPVDPETGDDDEPETEGNDEPEKADTPPNKARRTRNK